MKKKFFQKCILTLGFTVLLTLAAPFFNDAVVTAKSIETGKKEDYKLNLSSITLVKGKSYPLKAYNLSEKAQISFKSDDKEIASVSDEGVVTANKVGDTIIRAIIKDETETELTCKVTVGPPAFSIKLTKSRLIIGLEKSDFLNVILKPTNTVEVAKFSSKDPSIASVSAGGRVTAKNLGLTYVFAEIDATDITGARRYDTCNVIVTNPDDVPHLESYFIDHPELDMISKDDLTSALDEFFNVKYQDSTTASVTSSLNNYLDEKFNLAELRSIREAILAKYYNNVTNTTESTSGETLNG